MNKRKNLGQHFLKSKTIARSIVDSAKITRNDIVLEIGTGHGILIPYICKNAKQVFSIENDHNLYLSANSFCTIITARENFFCNNHSRASLLFE